ncbi:MAG: alpha/beta hydrolase-fold protein [Gemmatimonadota bacterium]|nr:alpha/beta hydrolase-fold protein [Gemmatimonadota bacterium]
MTQPEYYGWHSPALGRQMELLSYGHGGARVIAFPTSMGRFSDWTDRGLVSALQEHLDRGWLQIFCVDGVDTESWYNKWIPAGDRARRHHQYDRYLREELLPFTASRNSNPYVIATGPSFGAYQAVNFAFRHPDLINRVLGMSGLYDIKQLTDGYSDEDVYFNNPSDFLRNEHDPWRLDALRRMDIILAVGRDDSARANNEELSATLHSKGVPHALRIWDGWAHDWPYWTRMIQLYIGGHD